MPSKMHSASTAALHAPGGRQLRSGGLVRSFSEGHKRSGAIAVELQRARFNAIVARQTSPKKRRSTARKAALRKADGTRRIVPGRASKQRAFAEKLHDPSSAAFFAARASKAEKPPQADPMKRHLIEICHVNPRFVKRVKDLDVIQTKLEVSKRPQGVEAPLNEHDDTDVKSAEGYLKSELEKYVATMLASSEYIAAWSDQHEKAFTAHIRSMPDVKLRSARGRMGSFLRTKLFNEVHGEYMLTNTGKQNNNKGNNDSRASALDKVQLFMARQAGATRMSKNFASTFTKQQQKLAYDQLAGHIVKQHNSAVDDFLKQRHLHLHSIVLKQRIRIKRQRDTFHEKRQDDERLRRFHHQVNLSVRRLEELYGPHWSDVLDAKVPQIRYGKERNAMVDAEKKLRAYQEYMAAKRSMQVDRMLASSSEYAMRVKHEGGGRGSRTARNRTRKARKRQQTKAATTIESIFRGYVTRLYAWALRYLLSATNLTRAFKRVVEDCGKQRGLGPVGIVKLLRMLGMAKGAVDKSKKETWNEAVEGVWVDLDADGNGLIDLQEFVPWFIRKLPRNGNVTEQLVVVQAVKALVSTASTEESIRASSTSPTRGPRGPVRRAPMSTLPPRRLIHAPAGDAAQQVRPKPRKRPASAASRRRGQVAPPPGMPFQTPEDALRESAAKHANNYLRSHTFSRKNLRAGNGGAGNEDPKAKKRRKRPSPAKPSEASRRDAKREAKREAESEARVRRGMEERAVKQGKHEEAAAVILEQLKQSRAELHKQAEALRNERSSAVADVLRAMAKTHIQEGEALKTALDIMAPDIQVKAGASHAQQEAGKFAWASSGPSQSHGRVRSPKARRRELEKTKRRNSRTLQSYSEFLDDHLIRFQKRRASTEELAKSTADLLAMAEGGPAAGPESVTQRVVKSEAYKMEVKRIDKLLDEVWEDDS